MKNIVISAILLLSASVSMARTRTFMECISERAQAYNSDIYYNMSQEEILAILDDQTHVFRPTIAEFANSCLENPNP